MKTKFTLLLILTAALTHAAEPAKADACCAAPIDNSKFKIENLSKDSLYQLDARFTDDAGHAFSLSELRGRPVVLTMFFSSCGYACPLLIADMQRIREQLPAAIRGRTAFVLVSFDVARDTPAALATFRAEHSLDAQWTLLHGDADSIRELAALLGVKYQLETGGAFSHSNLITILNPAGEIAYQRTGLKDGLDEAAAALVRATAP